MKIAKNDRVKENICDPWHVAGGYPGRLWQRSTRLDQTHLRIEAYHVRIDAGRWNFLPQQIQKYIYWILFFEKFERILFMEYSL